MRPISRIPAALALAASFSLNACGGGGSHGAPAVPSLPAANSPSGPLSTSFFYDSATVQRGQLIAPARFANLAIDVVLKMQDPAGLRAYAQSVSTPKSALYRQFLTPGQIASRFGASQATQDAAVKYFAANGLRVRGWSQRMMLKVVGTQPQLERAFNTTFGYYRVGTSYAIAPMTAPRVPVGLGVVGSTNIVHHFKPLSTSHVLAAGNGRLSGLSPQQIANAFDFTGAYNAGYTGRGITVGIIGTGPISVQSTGHLGDVEAFKALYNVGGASTVAIVAGTDADMSPTAASGFLPPPPVTGSTATCNNDAPAGEGFPGTYPAISPTAGCNPEDDEAQIDTEQTASLAKDSLIQFFLSYNPNDGCVDATGAYIHGTACPTAAPAPTSTAPGAPTAQPAPGQPGGTGYPLQGLGEIDEELQSAIHANSSDILSMSFGASELSQVQAGGTPPEFDANGNGVMPTEMAALVSEGIALFVSAGDSGAEECNRTGPIGGTDSLCVSYPGSDPNVVSVGGVTTPVDAAGNLIGPMQSWGLGTHNGTQGTGGGVSNYIPLPAYQQGVTGVVGTTRNVPDLALDADPSTGVASVENADPSLGGRTIFAFGGTSVAAPQMAAMWALVLQACKASATCNTGATPTSYRLGNPDPLLYGIYNGTGKLPYANVFYDVTFGNNAQVPGCGQNGAPACPSPGPSPLDPGYNAGVGYDLNTGIGVPFARRLIQAIAGV